MQILINHKVISDSPYNGANEDIFVFDDEDLISQIKQEILNGTPTCFLVSGYRGVGKTSFIKRVERDIKIDNPQAVFIKLNFSKYESYSLLLRKIIREVYLSISETHNINDLKKQNKEVITSLELLFERTFHEVLGSQKNSLKQESITSTNVQVNIKKLFVAILTLFVTGINIKFDLIGWFLNLKTNKYVDLILFSLPIFWATIELINVKQTINKNKTDLLEINRKTLYDDEIAEYQLNKTLKDINSLGIQPVFIIDELDKIDDTEKVETLIGELKPLMLSGLASFILVSGQNLYYKFHTAHILDDALIASIFSKTVHIPLLSTRKFFELFSNILNNSNLVNEKTMTAYVKSKILNSNKLPRRFLNLIRQDLVWKENKAYLELIEEDTQVYITDAKLLEIIDQIHESELLQSGYSEGITDFFITQLHIWIQKMKLKGTSYFNKDDVYNLDNDYKFTHPTWYLTRLNTLIVTLLEKMNDSGLLEKKIEKSDDGEIPYYKWTDQATIKTETLINENDELQSLFLRSFIEFEKYLREIYIEVSSDRNSKYSILQMIKRLVEIEMLPQQWIINNELHSLTQLRNKIVHGETITLHDLDVVQNYAFKINKMRSQLIEEYTYFITKQYLEPFEYSLTKELTENLTNINVFDFRARSQSNNIADVLFVVKVLSSTNNATRKELLYKTLKKLEEYNDNIGRKNYLVYFIYAQNGRKIYDKFEEQLERILQHDFPHLKDYVLSFYNSEYRGDANQSRLKIYLDKLMVRINQI